MKSPTLEKARQGGMGEKSDIYEHPAGAFSSYSLRVGYRNSNIPKVVCHGLLASDARVPPLSSGAGVRMFLDARDVSALQACGSPLLRGIIPNCSDLKMRGDVAKLAYAQDLKS